MKAAFTALIFEGLVLPTANLSGDEGAAGWSAIERRRLLSAGGRTRNNATVTNNMWYHLGKTVMIMNARRSPSSPVDLHGAFFVRGT